MTITRYFSAIIAAVGLMGLSSCATLDSIRPAVPAEASFDPEAGRGGYLRLKLHLENGEELNCMLDSGSPVTLLDRSLEPKLGKRLNTYNWVNTIGGTVQDRGTNGVYLAPKLYLGATPLLTRPRILTDDLGDHAVRLGMDVLRHYCIQLDFTAHKIRFLDPDALDTNGLGKAFPITFSRRDPVIVHAGLLGAGSWMIDTGTPPDGGVDAKYFDRALREQHVLPFVTKLNDTQTRGACFPKGVIGGYTYSNLFIAKLPQNFKWENILGLNLLARNLVTLNFPRRMMFLKQVTQEALDSADYVTFDAGAFLESISEQGQLPGWSKNKGEIDWTPDPADDSLTYPVSRTFKFQTGGWVNVTPKIKSLAAVGQFSFPVNNRLAGRDPAPDILKSLHIEIRGYGLPRTVEVKEGETLALPAGVKIIRALYGNLEGENTDPNHEKGAPSTFHYTVVRESKELPWKLQKAWRTDANERLVEEYSIPDKIIR